MLIAIDPGASGGIAVHIPEKTTTSVPMPKTRGDLIEFARSLTSCSPEVNAQCTTVYIEKIEGYIPRGANRGFMYEFGVNVERAGCVFQTLGCKIIEVPPQKWQKHIGLGKCGKVQIEKNATPETMQAVQKENSRLHGAWKNKLKDEAQRRFPNIKVTLKNCDALLILEYALWREKGAATDWLESGELHE